MLETLGEPDIRKMSIEEPEKIEPTWLAILDELTENDVRAIQKHLEDWRMASELDDFNMLNFPVVIRTVKSLGIPAEITPQDFVNMERVLDKYIKAGMWRDATDLASGIKQIGGDPKLNPTDLIWIEHRLAQARENAKINKTDVAQRLVYQMLHHIKVLGINTAPTLEERAYLIQKLMSCQSSGNHNAVSLAYWSRIANELGVEVVLTPEDISSIQNELEAFFHKQDWGQVLSLADNMKYLSERMINLQAGPGLSHTNPPIPEERKF